MFNTITYTNDKPDYIHPTGFESLRWFAEAAVKEGVDLTYANLASWPLTYAKLIRAELTGATLTDANLTSADLWCANLESANLAGAKLRGAELFSANLSSANLTRANLTGARLWKANLKGADLKGADLTGANLTEADLSEANLTNAVLKGTKLPTVDSAVLPTACEASKTSDAVVNPPHYEVLEDVEAKEIIAKTLTKDQWYGFCLGCILRYRLRAGKKGDPLVDLAKATQFEEIHKQWESMQKKGEGSNGL